MKFRGSETETNIVAAIHGEAAAIQRYKIYAEAAREEGLFAIADRVFEATSLEEGAHHKRLWSLIAAGMIEEPEEPSPVSVNVGSAVTIGKTLYNLKKAVAGEDHEYKDMYADFAKKALEESRAAEEAADKKLFQEAHRVFMGLLNAERTHSVRFEYFADLLTNEALYARSDIVTYRCSVCGYVVVGKKLAVPECPLCKSQKGYFYVIEDDVAMNMRP